MNSFETYFLISGILGFIGQSIILISAAIYYFKTKSIGGLLMLIGSLLIILVFIAQPIITAIFATKFGAEELVLTQGVIAIAQSLFGLLFATGFVMSILKAIKN